MDNSRLYALLLVAIAALVTILLRAVPFLLFGGGRQMPPMVKKVADVMPPTIIAVLVVYCLKGQITSLTMDSVCAAVAVVSVVVTHLWKRQTLLSVAVGTIVYMVLIRVLM